MNPAKIMSFRFVKHYTSAVYKEQSILMDEMGSSSRLTFVAPRLPPMGVPC